MTHEQFFSAVLEAARESVEEYVTLKNCARAALDGALSGITELMALAILYDLGGYEVALRRLIWMREEEERL